MYIGNAAVDKIDKVLDPEPITYRFQCETSRLNINQARIVSSFQETGQGCALVLGGIGILYETAKYGVGVYLSDLREREYGDWIVLWQAPRPLEEEPCSGRLYMSTQEGGEEKAGLTIYGAEVHGFL